MLRTIKIIIGVISISYSSVILLQSNIAGALLSITGNTVDASADAGAQVGMLFIIAGILLLLTINGVVGGLVSGLIYLFAALVGFTNGGIYGDLTVWSSIALLFGLLIIWGEFNLS